MVVGLSLSIFSKANLIKSFGNLPSAVASSKGLISLLLIISCPLSNGVFIFVLSLAGLAPGFPIPTLVVILLLV